MEIEAHATFHIFLIRIHLDLAEPVYFSAIKKGSEMEWNFLWNKFKSSEDFGEKMIIVDALGYTKDANLLKVCKR